MNKNDLATVLVRFAGLYFAYLAVKNIAGFAYAIWVLSWVFDGMNEGMGLSDRASLSTAIPGAISFLISAGIAYYLLRKGTRLIDFLSKDSPHSPNGT